MSRLKVVIQAALILYNVAALKSHVRNPSFLESTFWKLLTNKYIHINRLAHEAMCYVPPRKTGKTESCVERFYTTFFALTLMQQTCLITNVDKLIKTQ